MTEKNTHWTNPSRNTAITQNGSPVPFAVLR